MAEQLESRRLLSAPPASLQLIDGRRAGVGDVAGATAIWVVVHGVGGYPADPTMQTLARAVDGASATDRVLMLDWRGVASTTRGSSADTHAVAQSAADQLRGLGVGARQVNLIAFSLGAPVAAELARMINHGRQTVQSLIALDPAAPRGADAGAPNHGRPFYTLTDKARFSMVFYSGSRYSYAPRAASARYTVRVNGLGDQPLEMHTNLPLFFARMVAGSNPGTRHHPRPPADQVSANFSLARLTPSTIWPWRTDSYDGMNEAVITAKFASSAFAPATLDYISARTRRQVEVGA